MNPDKGTQSSGAARSARHNKKTGPKKPLSTEYKNVQEALKECDAQLIKGVTKIVMYKEDGTTETYNNPKIEASYHNRVFAFYDNGCSIAKTEKAKDDQDGTSGKSK